MAVMARYNPFFEKAGMIRIAERRPPERVVKTLRVLEDLGLKRYLLTSVEYNFERLKEMTDDEMRRIKDALTATRQYKRLMSTRKVYPRKEEFKRWIENQSLEVIAKVLCRPAVLAETKVYLFWEEGDIHIANKHWWLKGMTLPSYSPHHTWRLYSLSA